MTRLFHPGTYAVPKDMPVIVAEQAIAAGVGVKELAPTMKAPEPAPEPEIPGTPAPEMAAAAEIEFQRIQGGEQPLAPTVIKADEPSDSADEDDDEDEEKPAPTRRRGRPRKGSAPQNKSRGRAPENKAGDAGDDPAEVG